MRTQRPRLESLRRRLQRDQNSSILSAKMTGNNDNRVRHKKTNQEPDANSNEHLESLMTKLETLPHPSEPLKDRFGRQHSYLRKRHENPDAKERRKNIKDSMFSSVDKVMGNDDDGDSYLKKLLSGKTDIDKVSKKLKRNKKQNFVRIVHDADYQRQENGVCSQAQKGSRCHHSDASLCRQTDGTSTKPKRNVGCR